MVKKTNGKKRSPVNVKDRKHWLFVIAIIIGVGCMLFAFFYFNHQRKIESEKNDLLNKHAQLEQIADSIADKYPPDERSSSRSCRYASDKYQKGALSCSVDVNLYYKATDLEDANKIQSKISNQLSIDLKADYVKNTSDEPRFGVKRSIYNSRVDYLVAKLDNPEDCLISIKYNSEKTTKLALVCNSVDPLAEHFPVEK